MTLDGRSTGDIIPLPETGDPGDHVYGGLGAIVLSNVVFAIVTPFGPVSSLSSFAVVGFKTIAFLGAGAGLYLGVISVLTGLLMAKMRGERP